MKNLSRKEWINRFRVFFIFMFLSSICSQTYAKQSDPNIPEDLFNLSIEELMDIEVVTISKKEATFFNTPAAITVITAEDIRRSGHQSIPETLRMAPGLHVAKINSNRWAITSRGFNGLYADKLLVMIDGRSVYSQLYSGVYWDVQDVVLEDIERIEVIKGPGGTLWGANAVNGIINIITKNAKDTQGTLVTGGVGTEERIFSTLRYGAKLGDDAYYRVYGKYFDRDDARYSNGDTANDGSDTIRGGFRIDWNKSEEDLITFQGDFYDGHSGLATLSTSPGINYTAYGTTDNRGCNFLTRWSHTYSDTSDMSLQFYYDRTERYSVELGEARDTFDIDFQHRFEFAEGHNLIWGLGYRHTGDNLENTYTVNFDPSHENEQLLTAFVQDEITIIDDLVKLIVGTKFENNDYTGNEFQPSVRVLWTPDERNTLWGAVTRAVSTPSRATSDLTNKYSEVPFPMQFTGNSDLDSQELTAYELGYRVKAKDNLLLDFALFYNEYENLYTNENNPTPFNSIFDNKMYGETYGGEMAAHWQITDGWNLTGGYTFLKMQMHTESSSTSSSRAERKEKETPRNLFNLTSQLKLRDNLEFNTSLYYVDNVPYYNISSYVRLDMGLTWHIKENIDVSIVGQNLLDNRHPEYDDDGTLSTEVQRGVFGKLTWSF